MAHTASQEWLNANLSRAYPFAESTGGVVNALPSAFLVNGCLLYDCSGAGKEVTLESAFIHHMTCDDRGVRLGLTCHISTNTNLIFDDLLFISYGAERNATVNFMSELNGVTVSGTFTVGDAKVMERYSGYYDIDETAGALCPSVLHDISGLYVTAIKVGDSYLTGEVELVAGDGIEITADDGRLVITNTKYTVPDDNQIITADSSLLETVIDTYGRPIKTLNGVSPDEDGNISVVTSEAAAGGDSIIVGTAGNGTITLELKKDPCVEDGAIESLSEKLGQLNERCSRINTSQLALDNAVNNLATQLTRLN